MFRCYRRSQLATCKILGQRESILFLDSNGNTESISGAEDRLMFLPINTEASYKTVTVYKFPVCILAGIAGENHWTRAKTSI